MSCLIFKIGFQLNVSKISGYDIVVEVHPRGQSKMNYGWSYFDFYRSKNGSWNEYYIEPIIETKIKTENHNCYQESDMNQANCFNDFYMSKLNCSFPWLPSSNVTREQCANKHFIKDLVDLIDGVIKGE